MKVLLIGRMASAGESLLRAALPSTYELHAIPNAGEAAGRSDLIRDADVIVGGPVSQGIVEQATKLKLVHNPGAGVDGMGLELLPSDVQVAHTFHHEVSIAEYIVMMMLMLGRRTMHYDAQMRRGYWPDSSIWGEPPAVPVLFGKTALMVGWGRIAKEAAARLKAFGVKIVPVSRTPRDGAVSYGELDSSLGGADFVVLSCPLTSMTRNLMGEAQFRAMKRDAAVINVARGGVVVEEALYGALKERWIGGAAIDVWYKYPKRRDEACAPSVYPFAELDNVIMSPHISGWTQMTLEGRMRDIAENILRVSRGEKVMNPVNRAELLS